MSAAQSATKGAMVEGTNVKQIRAWTRFQTYLLSIGLHSDPYLDQFNQAQWIKILSAFAQSIREGQLGTHQNHKTIKFESVRASLDSVAQAFRLADWADPRLDGDPRIAFLLQQQICGQNCPNLLWKAICKLFIGAFFFAMRSCEYVQVSGPHKTKLLVIKNIKFYKRWHWLNHTNPLLHLADCISFTFELQKKDTKGDTITQHRSSDTVLCPCKNLGQYYPPDQQLPHLKPRHPG